MKTNEILKLIESRDFIDKIYQFSYHRCSTSYDAQDLCSDIFIAVISAVQKQDSIDNFYAFVWSIARRVYADYSEKRNKLRQNLSFENIEAIIESKENEIDNFIEEAEDMDKMRKIFSEISFLSKMYRDVMVMYYIDEIAVKDIAVKLNIKETTVKQRLFSARNIVRKEVISMKDRILNLKPIRLAISGTGNPIGNDPKSKTERIFSQNLIYLCKDKPKTAKELSDELCVPMAYIEDELDIQCCGENGSYGMLRRLENGKYTTNILLADYSEYDEANKIYEKHISEVCKEIKAALEKNSEKILSFPYLSSQNDLRFILWALISRIEFDFEKKINNVLEEKYFSDVVPSKRPYTCAAVAFTDGQEPNFGFYGCDGISASSIGEYKNVFVSNIYGKRINEHFHCGHNISNDDKLLITIKAIGGLHIDNLAETEKEIAAKAIECGYLRKNGKVLEPNIIVISERDKTEFYNFASVFNNDMDKIIEKIAFELAVYMRKHIPKHLIGEYQIYTMLIAGVRILDGIIEKCIKDGLLTEPKNELVGEGVIMVVDK